MRLDKFLADMGQGSRKEVKQAIKKGLVEVNGQQVKSDKFQVDEQSDQVSFVGERVRYQKDFYYLLNKPAGVISATTDREKTVLDLFAAEDYRRDLFPVGRLDKDTEGLLLITNDGQLAHRLLSPKKHVEKEYYAEVRGIMTQEDRQQFLQGIELDGEILMPAQLTILAVDEQSETSTITLILHEGKFHQVKRMVQAVGKEVTYLKRIRMGGLQLPKDLPLGEYRLLTEKELAQLSAEPAEN
ncbi:pseudouridine synthase [Enterococcus sp.]|uniref:pseudouridine synthase n=1 Tax=Enterococcus sp. TaxID=35783 RepID=UPI0025BAEB9D|nr:pseudouridine synthase [Enterococcus sp.]